MAIHDSLGDRMKEYESRNQYYLQKRTPVCIRVDMRAGHTFTRGFARPFDEVFGNAMVRTMEYCAKNIGNCIFAYCQSDEITFILVDYAKLETDAWFGYRTDKLCSIAASMATMAFNKFFENEVYFNFDVEQRENSPNCALIETYLKAIEKGAMFDARCFNIPKEEVTNLVYWRQVDAARNSIQMAARAVFSHAECDNKNTSQLQDMLMEKYNINWNNYPTRWKRGVCWTKSSGTDYEMPMLKGEDREYVDHLVYFMEET